jgi:hypothetical protein
MCAPDEMSDRDTAASRENNIEYATVFAVTPCRAVDAHGQERS